MNKLNRAIEIATEAHKGQVDKSNMPYLGHVTRVMDSGVTENEKIVGVLHDLIEDTKWTFEDLNKEGFSDLVLDALKALTKIDEQEDYDLFIERVKSNPLAIAVKLNDLSDNMDVRRLAELTDRDVVRLRKYLKAYNELLLLSK